MSRLRMLVAALLLMLVVVSQLSAQDRPALVGTWKATSLDVEFQDTGEHIPGSLGAHPHGYAIFTPQGRVMFYIEAEGRKVPTTDQEQAAANLSMVAYTGTYRLEGNRWITKVDGAWNVEWVGTEQERFFDLKGNTLSVTTPWILLSRYGNRRTRAYVRFERAD